MRENGQEEEEEEEEEDEKGLKKHVKIASNG